MNTSSDKPVIAVLGGTGREGSGLAFRLSAAGYIVVIGSRDAVKATQVAAELNAELSTTNISGTSYAAAANAATVIILAGVALVQMSRGRAPKVVAVARDEEKTAA